MDRIQLRVLGNKLLKTARFNKTGCGCPLCLSERLKSKIPELIDLLYPELGFVPKHISRILIRRNMTETTIQRICDYLHSIMETNKYTMATYKTSIELGSNNYDLVYCHACGLLVADKDCVDHSGSHYCSECWSILFVCPDCKDKNNNVWYANHGNSFRVYNQTTETKTYRVCHNCIKTYQTCSMCGIGERKDLVVQYEKQKTETNHLQVARVCRSCETMYKVICSKCGGQTHKSVAHVLGDLRFGERIICPVCYEESYGIQKYWYKPLHMYFQIGKREGKVSQNAFHMGFELEVAGTHSMITEEGVCHMLKDCIGADYIYCMGDGSIRNAAGYIGFEVVSHPFTWEEYRKEGVYRWDKMCMFLRDKGYKANIPGLGIHIHTTKAAWGTHQIYKLLKFVNNNAQFVQHIAQRGPTQYCIYQDGGSDDRKQQAMQVAKEKKNREGHHYSVINLNNGDTGLASKTIEFRMFQGTLEPWFFHKNIEFVHACYKFTEHSKSMLKNKFMSFVASNRKTYPCLYEFLNR